MRTPRARLRPAAALALALASWGCGPSVAEGTARPLKLTWPGGATRTAGTEVFRAGKWVKEGEFVFFDEAGDETHRGSYANGLETGVWRTTGEDGAKGVGEFVQGLRQGEWSYFHENGKLAERGRYERGERVGVWQQWSPAGEPRPDRTYD